MINCCQKMYGSVTMKSGKIKRRTKRYIAFAVNLVCVACAVWYILAHFDAETAENTVTERAVISDVQHIRMSRHVGYIAFSTDKNDYFCKIDAPFFSYQKQVEARDALLAQFKAAARDGVEITIISTDEKLGLSLENPQGRRWAVGVYAGDETLCSLDEHNSDQHSTKVTLLIAAAAWLVLSGAYFAVMEFLEPQPRKRKRSNSSGQKSQ